MQQFLTFWNTHNVTIIEVLIAVIVMAVAFIIYNMAFGAPEAPPSSAQIEKTLQKILDAQAANSALAGVVGAPADPASEGASEAAATAALASDDVVELKAALKDKQAQIEKLKISVAEATAAAAAAPAGGAMSEATPAVDTSKFEARIRELEGNLAEYEIISEDIADLSKYKEENVRLQQELQALKSGGTSASLASEAAAEEPAADELDAAMAEALAMSAGPTEPVGAPTPAVEESFAASASDDAMNAAMAEGAATPAVSDEELLKEFMSGNAPEETPVVEPVAAASAGGLPSEAAVAPDVSLDVVELTASVVDDELMKEFAAAVEGQKSGTPGNDTDKLMNEFETFIKKG